MDEILFEGGMIKEHWGITDTMGVMLQLGGHQAHVEYPGGSSLYLDGVGGSGTRSAKRR